MELTSSSHVLLKSVGDNSLVGLKCIISVALINSGLLNQLYDIEDHVISYDDLPLVANFLPEDTHTVNRSLHMHFKTCKNHISPVFPIQYTVIPSEFHCNITHNNHRPECIITGTNIAFVPQYPSVFHSIFACTMCLLMCWMPLIAVKYLARGKQRMILLRRRAYYDCDNSRISTVQNSLWDRRCLQYKRISDAAHADLPEHNIADLHNQCDESLENPADFQNSESQNCSSEIPLPAKILDMINTDLGHAVSAIPESDDDWSQLFDSIYSSPAHFPNSIPLCETISMRKDVTGAVAQTLVLSSFNRDPVQEKTSIQINHGSDDVGNENLTEGSEDDQNELSNIVAGSDASMQSIVSMHSMGSSCGDDDLLDMLSIVAGLNARDGRHDRHDSINHATLANPHLSTGVESSCVNQIDGDDKITASLLQASSKCRGEKLDALASYRLHRSDMLDDISTITPPTSGEASPESLTNGHLPCICESAQDWECAQHLPRQNRRPFPTTLKRMVPTTPSNIEKIEGNCDSESSSQRSIVRESTAVKDAPHGCCDHNFVYNIETETNFGSLCCSMCGSSTVYSEQYQEAQQGVAEFAQQQMEYDADPRFRVHTLGSSEMTPRTKNILRFAGKSPRESYSHQIEASGFDFGEEAEMDISPAISHEELELRNDQGGSPIGALVRDDLGVTVTAADDTLEILCEDMFESESESDSDCTTENSN